MLLQLLPVFQAAATAFQFFRLFSSGALHDDRPRASQLHDISLSPPAIDRFTHTTHTHTHTHTHTLCVVNPTSPALHLSLSYTHTHTHTHTVCPTPTSTALSLTHTHTQSEVVLQWLT